MPRPRPLFFKDHKLLTQNHWRSQKFVRFCHNQLQKPLFGQITKLQVTNIEDLVTNFQKLPILPSHAGNRKKPDDYLLSVKFCFIQY